MESIYPLDVYSATGEHYVLTPFNPRGQSVVCTRITRLHENETVIVNDENNLFPAENIETSMDDAAAWLKRHMKGER